MLALFYITVCLLLCYGVLIRYYAVAWRRIPVPEQHPADVSPMIKVTVIVPARDEEHNIRQCLDAITAQKYPHSLLEIIIVNDHSTDDTAGIVQRYPAPNVRLVDLSEWVSGSLNSYKKKALEVAVSLSSGELIVTTDADCTMGTGWISSLVACYTKSQAVFIAAPVKIVSSGSLLSIFQALDFMTLQGITGASVYRKFHSMCNGANLAYSKEAFYAVGGFQGIDQIASGDDMLLMHKIFLKYPDRISFLKTAPAVVSTQPAPDWKAFLHQRIRWASKADKYDDRRIFWVLLGVYLTNVLCLFFGLALFWNLKWGLLFLLLLLLKTILEFSFVYEVAAFFGQRSLMAWFPLMQPFHVVYTVAAGFLGKFGRYEWKRRKVR